jgi:hypothetical protein
VLELARLLHSVFGEHWPKSFVAVCAIFGAFTFGGVAFLLVAAAKKASTPPPTSPIAVESKPVPPPVEPPIQQKASIHKVTKKIERSIIQNAPQGINIGGDNNGTAIVNNGPPPLELKWTSEDAPATVEYPYAKTVVVRSNQIFSPVSLIVICSAEIKLVSPGGFMTRPDFGVTQQSNRIGYVYYESPPLAPGVPLSIGIAGQVPFKIEDVKPANIQPRKNVLDR